MALLTISPATALFLLSAAAALILFPPPAAARSYLLSGESLSPGEYLSEGIHTFILRRDCNLVLHDRYGRVLWATNTGGRSSSCNLLLQPDGNLVIYDFRGWVIWDSGTNGPEGDYVLVLQHNRKVVLYGTAVWSTADTDGRFCSGVVVAGGNRNGTATSSAGKEKEDQKIAEVAGVNGPAAS
ncbi:Mannose-specific lectin [Apostasia shenzhenica]|uniref:Mannose-specific lectin n=1 Tax=Apostasia shenzhenica TaxID=1088818 RepID=A0A2I0A8V0_9ASPA|nr:Mannose-specific lectin [Apostasia shenzhenica]